MNLLNSLKKLSNNIIVYIALGFIIYLLYTSNVKLRNSVSRLENNQIALTEQYSRQLELNKQDFQRIYHKEDSIAKLVGIKTNQIQEVIVNNYHYKDTSIVNFPLDTTKKDTLKFISPLGCMKVEGYVANDHIYFTNKEYNDKLHTYLYKVDNKRVSFRNKGKIGFDHSFLFIKWNNHIDAKTYSECKQDTVSIERNIKVR